jgi:hypothetical protein
MAQFLESVFELSSWRSEKSIEKYVRIVVASVIWHQIVSGLSFDEKDNCHIVSNAFIYIMVQLISGGSFCFEEAELIQHADEINSARNLLRLEKDRFRFDVLL